MSFANYRHECGKGDNHKGKEIIMVCLNSQCDARRLCCLACIDDIHRKHQLISLYKFDEKLKILTKQSEPELKLAVIALTKNLQINLDKNFDKIVENFNKNISKFRERLKTTFTDIYEAINLNFTSTDIQSLYSDFTNSKVCRYLDLVKQAENEVFNNVENAASMYKIVQNTFVKQIQEFEKNYEKGVEEISKGISKLEQIIKQKVNIKKRIFSKLYKAVSISVNQSCQEAKRTEGAGGYPIVLVQQPLTEANDSVNVIVKEQPGNKGVWMGVCVLDIVKTFNFASCYGMGKGAWAIDQVGASHQSAYSWNHHDSNFNSQPKVGWQFNTGDTVNIKVNFAKSTVIFTRGTNTYEMPIRLDLGQVYAFVGPTHINDTIVIV